MSENYDDDSVWETYTPEVGGLYSEGAWRHRNNFAFKIVGWKVKEDSPVINPHNDELIYVRRRKQAKPEPADDGPKFETKFGADIYQARDLRLSVVMNKDIITIEDCEADMITVRVDEWPALRAAIDRLIGECRE